MGLGAYRGYLSILELMEVAIIYVEWFSGWDIVFCWDSGFRVTRLFRCFTVWGYVVTLRVSDLI